jgi:phosphatidylinositol alpha-1,6-mannosyltransferase
MRIALLTPEFDATYGWASYARELATALRVQGVDVRVFTQPGAVSSETFESLPVLPLLVPPPRGFLLRSLAAVERVRRVTAGCDLLHVVAEPYSLLAAAAAGSRPVIVTAHGTYVPQTARRRSVGWLYRRAYRHAHLIAVSDYTARQVRHIVPDANLTVIRNGVHFARFQVGVPEPERTGPTILAVGGVKRRKGTRLLIEALVLVRERVPGTQLVITGRQDDQHYLAEIRERAAALGVNDQVHLVGQIPEDELRAWYQHADVFALPSLTVGGKFEGFGLAFLEASASGLPVVGTTGSGVEEAVIDGETGLLVPQNDVPALADAITRLLSDAALRARMGTAGRDYAQTQDWSAVAGRVMALYQQVVS